MTPPAVLAASMDAPLVRLPTLLSALGLTPSLAQPLPSHADLLAGIADLPDLPEDHR
ncbi:hypothetical protein [Streptomyces sp. MJP52]|uniref:hypothetical protein n=1 Tax=Streptomyces sp. MJP52 TaxID=2940555 RepID=UPI002472E9A2|nr:hypothetical protein [Streptomyces sp. MJP52]MDH6226247.1 hypothetical protein [Streptomyces sp. MJP52]